MVLFSLRLRLLFPCLLRRNHRRIWIPLKRTRSITTWCSKTIRYAWCITCCGPERKAARHSHPDGVNVFLTDAHYRNIADDGKITELQAKAGSAAWRPALTHVTENIGDKPLEGVLVEPKQPHSARPAGSVDVTTLPMGGKLAKVIFENEKVRVLHYHFEPGQKDEMHGHPDSVQIVLTDTKSEVTTPDGKTTTVEAKAGQVVWRPALQHSVRNIGDKPIEGVLVEMKGAPVAASK